MAIKYRHLIRSFLIGLAAAMALMLVYVIILSLVQGASHAYSQFMIDKWYILPIDISFGAQVGLYTYLHFLVRQTPKAIPTVSGSASTIAMILCCVHHVADILPIIGLSAASMFFTRYSTEFFISALAINLAGLIVILYLIAKEKRWEWKGMLNRINLLRLLLAASLIYIIFIGKSNQSTDNDSLKNNQILPSEKISLSVRWGNLGKQMVKDGVIDEAKFYGLYKNQNISKQAITDLLQGADDTSLNITSQNSALVLNLFWGLGLANQNNILQNGPMNDPKNGGAGNFASTGGWTITKGNAMDHYSHHRYINLTPDQQSRVEKVAKNIYRPCCDNSTYFPDCNHGMAMLGFLEMLAYNNYNEKQMYDTALKINTLWFPDNYQTIALYLTKNPTLPKPDPQELLSQKYSGRSGFAKIAEAVGPTNGNGGGKCSV